MTLKTLLRRPLLHPRSRTFRFWTVMATGTFLMASAMAWLLSAYRIGYSNEAEQSIGTAWTWVRLTGKPVVVGSYGVFETDRRASRFPPGTRFVKLIVGAPGDLVHVGTAATTVNGREVAGPLDSADELGVSSESLERTIILGPDEYFAVGTRPHSYDSRYWGPVRRKQFVGAATLL